MSRAIVPKDSYARFVSSWCRLDLFIYLLCCLSIYVEASFDVNLEVKRGVGVETAVTMYGFGVTIIWSRQRDLTVKQERVLRGGLGYNTHTLQGADPGIGAERSLDRSPFLERSSTAGNS